ncbi:MULTISPECIES: flagellar motor switch phosphatase FliY [Bacillaceae]|uniref:Flagellar motor switch phosphatase FliY n=1 Tax=Evansella alkalicola TaxID=745819 RepID=A0ABS6JRJ0_9BACI|nr:MULTISPECIES: flagellar motor switch phosphatase FliY [Bacillaceae]MBU9720329.1 flagellar motor switch phosphatase FliY [Bacillus alkalicola]
MSDEMLSQDEINALLSGLQSDEADTAEESEASKSLNVENYLSGIEQDAIGEIGNISFGSAATALSTLLNQKVDITTPKVTVVKKKELADEFPKPHVNIAVHYTDGFEGMNLLVVKTRDAAVIADLMLGNDGLNVTEVLGEMEISAVQEAMNQMMGSASTSMSTIFNKRVDISPPGIDILEKSDYSDHQFLPDEDVLVKISFNLKVGDLIDSKIMQLIPVSFSKDLVEELMNPSNGESVEQSQDPVQGVAKEVKQEVQQNAETTAVPESSYTNNDLFDNHRQEPVYEQRSHQQQHITSTPERTANVHPAAFTNFDATPLGETEAKNLEMLFDIPLQVTVELGRTKRTIKDILELAQGSIIELDKLAGEPVDILVNQKLIAKGEVVVIDENFGVRVTDIVSKKERINKL